MKIKKKQTNIIDIVKYPIITDKTTSVIEDNIYCFAVNKTSNKYEIKKAIEKIFNVKVNKINTTVSAPKNKKVGKTKGQITQYKKAIVKLHHESKINLFEDT